MSDKATGWTCFHCGEHFTDQNCARLHFGATEDSAPACQIKAGAEGSLLRALRDAEEEADRAMQAIHDECTDAAKAYHAQRCRHNQSMIAAEELGYERGLYDARTNANAEMLAKLRNVISHASGGHLSNEGDTDRTLNDICVQISRHHNRVFEGGKESAKSAADALAMALEAYANCNPSPQIAKDALATYRAGQPS